MKSKGVVIGIILAAALSGGFLYRFTHLKDGGGSHAEKAGHQEEKGGHQEEKGGGHDGGDKGREKQPGHEERDEHADGDKREEGDEHAGHDEHDEPSSVKMTAAMQKRHGVVVVPSKKQRLGGVLAATGKVEANADRIAQVSPRISGKVVAVRGSLGDSVAAGQSLATLDSVELAEALGRHRQLKTAAELARSSMERVRLLVEKKITARKELLQAEADFRSAQAELHSAEERLSLYGVAPADLKGEGRKKPLLAVRSPIGGVITEKHAVVGELADPSKSLYTVADLSSVWVLVDVNEADLAKVRKGQAGTVSVGAFPDLKLKGRVTYVADLLTEETRTVKARIEVANPGRRLKPGMFVGVELALPADAPPVLAVPEVALQELEGKKVLFVTEDGAEFEPRQVELGRSSGGMAEIVSGLKEGERYAATGSFLLKSELQKGELGEHGH